MYVSLRQQNSTFGLETLFFPRFYALLMESKYFAGHFFLYLLPKPRENECHQDGFVFKFPNVVQAERARSETVIKISLALKSVDY